MEKRPSKGDLTKLVNLVSRLRSPKGCPWDRQQDLSDIKTYLMEEAYEVLEAVDSEDMETLKEELGDLLFQIVFLAHLAEERGAFDIQDVVEGIHQKMIRRHPHVFGGSRVNDPNEVAWQWDEIKANEGKSPRTSVLSGRWEGLPALYVAYCLGIRAAKVGFDWPGPMELLQKVKEELAEMESALGRGMTPEALTELGDLLFALANLARHLDSDPEGLLRRANRKFIQRFMKMESMAKESGRNLKDLSSEELEGLWERAKESSKVNL
jgi:MazG family protein